MQVGHIFKIDNTEYCICDIKEYGNKKFAYTISGPGQNFSFNFFKLDEDENGTFIQEVTNVSLIGELLKVFVCE